MIRWSDHVPPQPNTTGSTGHLYTGVRVTASRLRLSSPVPDHRPTDEERDLALGALARLRPIDPVDLDLLLRCIRPDLTVGERLGAWHGVCAVIDAEGTA